MIDVLIPVLGRPHNVQALIESLRRNSAGEHRVWFICTQGDRPEIRAVEAEGLTPLIHPHAAGAGNFAKKINWAFSQTQAEWVFQGADDIRFSPNWDSHALLVAERTGASVIGTNDLHNPSVRSGGSATHLLFRRSYIEEYGGTFDDSGTVFSEAYDHQFVDNEFVETAKLRGQWAFAKRAVVEHFHPHWGNAQMDATYRKAMRRTLADKHLFNERMRLMRGEPLEPRRRTRYSSRR